MQNRLHVVVIFSFKFNAGMPFRDDHELQPLVLGRGNAKGELEEQPAIATQLAYEINGSEYLFAKSFRDFELDYHAAASEVTSAGCSHIQPLLFSAQYNEEKITLTGEYNYPCNTFGAFAPAGTLIRKAGTFRAAINYYRNFSQQSAMMLLISIRTTSGAGAGAPGSKPFIDAKGGLSLDSLYGLALEADNHADTYSTTPDWDWCSLQLSFKF
ncbi:hypothetical protein METHB2_700020 [Candidatus Methylobacter favarea]|uniref:Uncharacterized protein n=1 Tax=Candidatus Methylobacter favarea TaxID=2707345 RepID=A0A8S0WCH4_9GAMM|nr:hypothetical protein [Candidatus Methylobacter favarea]CAA9892525.1 hypothetical protein METHB2_700020 [Candidatus Methylobacter favarea]